MTKEIKKKRIVEKDARPVRCYICGKKMYYAGHPKSEKEYKLYDYGEQIGYVHASCIKFLRNKKQK